MKNWLVARVAWCKVCKKMNIFLERMPADLLLNDFCLQNALQKNTYSTKEKSFITPLL